MKKLFSLLTLALLTMSAWAATSYVKVTDASQIVAGKKYIIVNENAAAFMGAVGSSYAAAVTGPTISQSAVTIEGTEGILELTLGGAEGAWTFTADGTNYIAYTSSGNNVNLSTDASATSAQWTATASTKETGGYILTNVGTTERVLQYNASSPRFACYKGTQQDAVLYVENADAIVVASPSLPASQNFTGTLSVEITNNETGATLYYSFDEEEWNVYSTALTLTETTTVYAKAVLNGVESTVVSATYTLIEAYEGTDITFVALTDTVEGGSDAGWKTLTKDGITMKFYGTVSNYTLTDSLGNVTAEYHQYRIHKNYSIQFTTTVGNIRKIQFTCPETNPVTGFGEVAGLDYTTGIWEGNTRDITFNTTNKQVRAEQIIVTVDQEIPETPDVVAPVIAPESCKFNASIEVSITCETEGADIYYTINDGEETLYTAPFTLTETATVSAYADLDGVESSLATATYTQRAAVATIAEANALESKTDFYFTGNVIAVYQNKSNLWVKDATGFGLIYGNQVPTIAEGATIATGWDAQYTFFRDAIHEYQYPNNVTATDAELVTIEPTEYTAITTDNINERVIMKGLTLIAETDTTVSHWDQYIYNAADSMVIFNQFGIEVPTFEEGKTYDVEGMVSYYNNAVQIMPIAITESVATEVLRGDVDQNGEVQIADVTTLIDLLLSGAEAPAEADCDLNSEVGIADVTALIDYLLSGVWPE